MKKPRLLSLPLLAMALAGACAPSQAADLAFARVFSDHAVLQRGQRITVWGSAAAGSAVTLTLDGGSASSAINKSISGKADNKGKWRLQLPQLPAGGPYSLNVASNGASARLQDLMVGDVYLCSGQSNMEFAVHNATNAWGTTNAAANPQLRFLNIEKASALTPQDELKQPAAWKVAAPDTIGDASAVCYFMARSLQQRYAVPVGFINASWGGTTIQGWIGADALRGMKPYAAGVDTVKELAADPARAMKREEDRVEAWWDVHDPAARAQRAFKSPGFDDSAWAQLTPSGSWKDSGIAALKDFDGAAWFRTTVELNEAQAKSANTLQLGPIETSDSTWVNGVRVGGGGTGWMGRDYPVLPGIFKSGRNVIAVRVLNGGQAGGLTGQPAARGVRTADGQFIPLNAAWKYRIGTPLKGQLPAPSPWDVPTSLSTLYNGMLAPLQGYKFKLAAWYQGESNTGAPGEYRELLTLMMRDWRRHFGQPELPFLVVQLPGYGAAAKTPGRSGWAELREAEAQAVQADAHAALAVTLDVGDRFDIHPTQKTVVGERLARAARVAAYGDTIAAGGPEAASATHSGNDIVIAFRHTAGGLITYSSDKAIGFETCAGEVCTYADATVEGDRVVLKGRYAAGVTRVRYGWADAPFVNLYGSDDLPAAPFRMDVE